MKTHQIAKSLTAYLSAFVLSLFVANSASAVLIIDFQSGTITPGGEQTIDVFLSSDAAQPEGIFLYDLSFVVNGSPTGDSSMTFVDPLNEDFIEEANYVFFGNSLNADNPPSAVFDITDEGDIALALDETSDGLNIQVSSTPVLLSRLSFQHNLASQTPESVNGDEYEITVGRDPMFDVAFEDEFGDPVNFEFGDRGFLTVQAVAIPEPGSFALMSLLGMGCVSMRRRRR